MTANGPRPPHVAPRGTRARRSRAGALRRDARKILAAGLAAVDPGRALERSLRLSGTHLSVTGLAAPRVSYDLAAFKKLFVIGAGKAAVPMARAIERILGARVAGGVVVTKSGQAYGRAGPRRIAVLEAGHPVPDQGSVDAAAALLTVLNRCTREDLVIFLLSGGASALIESPVAGVSLRDLQTLTRGLLACGAPIHEMNAVRKHLSRVKGGQLLAAAPESTVLTLIMSDVVADPLDVIGGGPTVPDPSSYREALMILAKHTLVRTVPLAVLRHLTRGAWGKVPETPKPGHFRFTRVHNVVVANNRTALEAASEEAKRLGFRSVVLTSRLEGEAREAGRFLAALARSILAGEFVESSGVPLRPPCCVLLGGETTVTLRGSGTGGRNQEASLAAALALSGCEDVLVACAATDGVDGPTDSTGAFADGRTVRRACEAGMDGWAFLKRNDSHTFFARLRDLITTGPTGTNVGDLSIVLVGKG